MYIYRIRRAIAVKVSCVVKCNIKYAHIYVSFRKCRICGVFR